MIKNLDAILAPIGISADDFKKQYEDTAEHEINVSEVEILKKTDLDTRMKNYANDEFTKKKSSILEIYNKEVFRDTFGMTIDKTEDAKSLAAKAKDKILADAKIAPNEKITELEKDKQTLVQQNQGWEKKFNELQSSAAQRERDGQLNNLIVQALPKVKTKIPLTDMALLFSNKFKPKMDENGLVTFHNEKGEVIKNATTLNPQSMDEVMKEFQTNYIETPEGGGGGGDGVKPPVAGSYDAFVKEMGTKGWVEGQKEFVDEMKLRIANKTLTI